MSLQAIKYKRGQLTILDQIRLPHEQVYVEIRNPQDGWNAIRSMQVRGAPAIAMVAALSLAVWLSGEVARTYSESDSVVSAIFLSLKFLVTSRPTAVNLLDAACKLQSVVSAVQKESNHTASTVVEAYLDTAEAMLRDDVKDNQSIGTHGAEWIKQNCTSSSADRKVSVITHCNTGSVLNLNHCESY